MKQSEILLDRSDLALGNDNFASQLAEFTRFCEQHTGAHLPSRDFHEFSVREFRTFWKLFLQ